MDAAIRATVNRMDFSRRLRVYALESRAQFLSVWRVPAFSVPTLVFPLMFYVFFGIIMGTRGLSLVMPTYLLATYGVFGIIGPALFGFGLGLSTERSDGTLLLKQTTPMPPAAYLVAKLSMALLFSSLIILGLFCMGGYLAGVELYRWQWFTLAGVLLLSTLPFCAMGLAIGTWVKAQAAMALVNAVYLPMAFLSGLWFPVMAFPTVLQKLANIFPAYHAAQLCLKVIDMDQGQSAVLHLGVLIFYTMAFLALAAVGMRRPLA
ncbi:MAG: ABC transporter permease [Xanthomonadales bacterium]|nr:ABC transporter permease [Xanthomonadales bacterium]